MTSFQLHFTFESDNMH